MKIIELADLHIDPKWIEQQKSCLNKILETGEKIKPDFICIAGDVYNRPFYNSDKDCIKYVLDYFEKLLKIASVVMVTGTPSHDAPGSYAIFEKMGCHVLHPAKPKIINECLFIGCREIDKTHFMIHYKLKDMNEINQAIKILFKKYITSYWAPVRENNNHIPCVFLGHGCFVDNINDNNPIIKNTDIVIDNNKLVKIKADRYIFGHFHIPKKSKILNGGYVGYMGFDRTLWNNTGFQPGFNITEIIETDMFKNYKSEITPRFLTETIRADYPVIRKEKVKVTVNFFNKNHPCPGKFENTDLRMILKIKKSDLLKIDIKEYEKKYKKLYNVHSVEIIPDIIKEESQRITHKQAERLNTLWDKYIYFKGWVGHDSFAYDGFKLKINEIEKNVSLKTQSLEKKVVKLLSLKVKGSIFSIDAQGKNTFIHDFSKDPTGLTLIAGDNGKGKSTFLGFASPFPIFIGWDYRSLKEFFPEGGEIIKIFEVNGVKHEHVISITQNKIECFWYKYTNIIPSKIAYIKQPQLKDFMIECEKFFGPVSSFISTSFFAQEPWRMKNYVSSLVSSSQTELRNAYMEIVGISREAEKLYAREKKETLKKEIEKLEIQKSTMSNIFADKQTINDEYEKLKSEINKLDDELNIIVHYEYEKQKEFNKIEKEYNEQLEIERKINNINTIIFDKELEKGNIENLKLAPLKKINITELQKQISDNEKTKTRIEKLRDKWQEVNKKKNGILEDIKCNESALNIHEKQFLELTQEKTLLLNKIKNAEKLNKTLNKPCFYCKKIDPQNEITINAYNKQIKKNTEKINQIDIDIKNFSELIEEFKKTIIELKTTLPDVELKELEETASRLKFELLTEYKIQSINDLISEYSQIKIYEENLNKINSQIKQLNTEITNLKNKENLLIESFYEDTKKELLGLQKQLSQKQIEQSGKEGMLNEIKKQINQIKRYENEITEILKKLDTLVIDMSEWEEIEKDMQPNKLPALELEIIAGDIDFQVNQKLNGRYIIKTNTQDINKKGEIIDRFDIQVYNPKSGIEKSLLAHSPGQRAAYFIEPISQALRKKRQQRENIIFTWSISDETDWPIKPIHILEYYEIMQAGLSPNHTRFVMSQKSEIENFIKNTINILDIGKNT